MNDTEIAKTIQQQCGALALMTVGAHEFRALPNGLLFHALIHRFLPYGERAARATTHTVEITLNAWDYYDIRVVGTEVNEVGEIYEVLHYSGSDYDFTQLPKFLVALDYDGPEILNLRYI